MALVVVVVLGWLTLFAAADGDGVRGLSDRLRGDGAEAPAPRGASAPPPTGR